MNRPTISLDDLPNIGPVFTPTRIKWSVCLIVILVVCVKSCNSAWDASRAQHWYPVPQTPPQTPSKPIAPSKPITPPQPKDASHLFSVWNGSYRPLVDRVKARLNDPKSFKHVETRYKEEGDYVYINMQYRAKNGFGGVVTDYAETKVRFRVSPPWGY